MAKMNVTRTRQSNRRPRWRRPLPLLAAVGILAAGAVFVLDAVTTESSPPGSANTFGPLDSFASGFSQPIAGVETSLAEARVDAAFPKIPVLPSLGVTNPCDGSSDTLTLVHSYVSVVDVGAADVLGFVYSDGVWMSISSPKLYSETAFAGSELASLDRAFPDPADRPADLSVTDVRGHVAWAKELSDTFACPQANPRPAANPSPGLSGLAELPPVFNPLQTASLRWIENGVVVHLVGPLPLEELMKVAEVLEWQ
jgi:hypothetical protein